MYELNHFGSTLLRLRKERGWTQAYLAEQIGISPQSISKWECGIGYPDVTLFPAIAALFSVPIGGLFGDTKKEPDRRFGMEREHTPPFTQKSETRQYMAKGEDIKQLFFYQNRDSSVSEYYRAGNFYFLYRSPT